MEQLWHDLSIRVPWLIDMCEMTDLYVWHVSLICVIRLSLHQGNRLLPCETILHVRPVMTHLYESWLIYMSHDSFIWVMTHLYESWLIYMSHDSFIWVMTHLYESRLIYMSHDSFITILHLRPVMTHLYESWLFCMSHDSFIWVMTHLYESWLIYMT